MKKEPKFKNERILVMADCHMPYHHPDMFDFLYDLNESFKPDRVISLGDIVDFYGMSSYSKDPDHKDSFANELTKIKIYVKILASIFPKMRITLGNHDDRLYRAASGAGVSRSMLKPFSSIIGSPRGWRFYKGEVQIRVASTGEKILFAHTRGANVFLTAQRLGQTVVTGHQHTKGGVQAFSNGRDVRFGCDCPNLISNEGCPFKYAKLQNINPVQGALIIEGGVPNLKLLR